MRILSNVWTIKLLNIKWGKYLSTKGPLFHNIYYYLSQQYELKFSMQTLDSRGVYFRFLREQTLRIKTYDHSWCEYGTVQSLYGLHFSEWFSCSLIHENSYAFLGRISFDATQLRVNYHFPTWKRKR